MRSAFGRDQAPLRTRLTSCWRAGTRSASTTTRHRRAPRGAAGLHGSPKQVAHPASAR